MLRNDRENILLAFSNDPIDITIAEATDEITYGDIFLEAKEDGLISKVQNVINTVIEKIRSFFGKKKPSQVKISKEQADLINKNHNRMLKEYHKAQDALKKDNKRAIAKAVATITAIAGVSLAVSMHRGKKHDNDKKEKMKIAANEAKEEGKQMLFEGSKRLKEIESELEDARVEYNKAVAENKPGDYEASRRKILKGKVQGTKEIGKTEVGMLKSSVENNYDRKIENVIYNNSHFTHVIYLQVMKFFNKEANTIIGLYNQLTDDVNKELNSNIKSLGLDKINQNFHRDD